MDQTVQPNGWPSINMPCAGVSVDNDQNVWGIDGMTSTGALVDGKGAITQPKVNGAPMGKNVCPAGDSCRNRGATPYSDMSGFGLHSISQLPPTYQILVPGCQTRGANRSTDTSWIAVNFDADVPPNTLLSVIARSGDSSDLSDPSWTIAQFTAEATTSPFSLQGNLHPNLALGGTGPVHDGWLLVEFIFRRSTVTATPTLKSFDVAFKCPK
jgi:hypothetical protein